jgi:hypothetical protein
MSGRYLVVLAAIALCASPRLSSAQNETATPAAPAVAAAPAETNAAAVKPVEASPAELQWLWGEVVSVDATAKSLAVKYLDYDTDEEKTMTIFVSDTTSYQETKGLGGIKPQDTISIEYTARDGKSFAKDITLERIEDTDTPDEQVKTVPPEKVGAGPVKEADGPVQPTEQQGQ